VSRTPELKTRFNRRYAYERAKCEDPAVIKPWFELVQRTIEQYGITTHDIYNFDETGFQMGVISTAKVVTGSERRSAPLAIQPGNREWVTVI
jgi:RecB family endonuclease NucS